MFRQDYLLQGIFVRGEVSNLKYHASGHIYFTLKDPQGVIPCVMFAGNRAGLSFRLAEGQQIVVGGTVDVYERDGRYQLYAKQIVLDGSGLLYEKFEQLKRELENAGFFDREHKLPIPAHIKTLGVVTADTGAAVRDIIQIAKRRNPYVQIILYPAIVQGEAAAPSIVRGIQALEQVGVDVMIVGRGGGSMEDLWAFNEKIVAQAVYDCTVPVISAVGHETDTTIIDYVSDLRAPTPSAAAELAVKDFREVLSAIDGYRRELTAGMNHVIGSKRTTATRYEVKLQRKNPAGRIRENRMMAVRAADKLETGMQRILQLKRHRLAIAIERMKGLSPLEKLNSGYAYVTDENGKNIKAVSQVCAEQNIRIRVSDGVIDATVKGTGALDE